jgi:SAM-dependent methyltransferase
MDLREIPTHAFKRHPWETVRADFFVRLLRSHVQGQALSVVDFGAGDGFLARRMIATWPAVSRVACFDPAYPADRTADPQADGRIRFCSERPAGACDVVLLLDVLEHSVNDEATLHDALSTCLRPGGWLLLSAPAHPMLFSRHDELLGHKRRYSPAALLALAKKEDLVIVEHGQLFSSLLGPRVLAKLGEALGARWTPVTDPSHIETALGRWNHGALVTAAVEAALALDASLARALARRRLHVPGLSTWVLGQTR